MGGAAAAGGDGDGRVLAGAAAVVRSRADMGSSGKLGRFVRWL